MQFYLNPEKKLFTGLSRSYIASKTGGLVLPHAIDIHPVSGRCNLDCKWCIGRFQRSKIDPLSELLIGDNLVRAISKILNPSYYKLWPSEFHICGCDSEPLLNESVLDTIKYLIQYKRVIELITNGLILDNQNIMSTVSRIQKLSISLDVTNDDDYKKYKLPRNSNQNNGYSSVINNIRNISKLREKYKSDLNISVTFVATPKTYNKDEWVNCFKELKSIGVQGVRVRDDLNNTFGPNIDGLKDDINEINRNLNDIKIQYISPESPYSDFSICKGPRLWPALAVDGCLYPCAHTATSEYIPFGNLINSTSMYHLYYDLFGPSKDNFITVERNGCKRNCPSILGSYNEPTLVEKKLGSEKYI